MPTKCRLKSIINQQKCLIIAGFILGLNRIHLLTDSKFYVFISYLYTLGVWIFTFGFAFREMILTRHIFDLILLLLCLTEYPMLVLHVLKFKIKEVEVFKLLDTFDKKMKMDFVEVYNQFNFIRISTAICVGFSFAWYMIMYNNLYKFNLNILYRALWVFSRDLEQMFYIFQLRNIYLRLSLLKAHVRKIDKYIYKSWMQLNKLNKIKLMSERVELDISTLHEGYEILHKCSTQLNRIMDVPVHVLIL